MRVGVLADTHDRLPAVAEFARRFREAGIGMVLHAGDYCASWSLRPIIAANLALAGVYGRNDGDHEGLQAEAAKGVGVEIYESPHSVELGGARLLLVHDIGDVNARSVAGHVIVIHPRLRIAVHAAHRAACPRSARVFGDSSAHTVHRVDSPLASHGHHPERRTEFRVR